VDYQKKADEAAWEWAADKASAAYCCKNNQGNYRVEMSINPDFLGEVSLYFSEGEKEVHVQPAHAGTVFAVKGTVLYYAEFHRMTSGCALVAYDLVAKKRLWKTDLEGLGPISHSKYFNAVTLDLDEDALCVRGKESAGNYIEYVDRKTGKTVGHKVFPRK
jgi:hypothetical protein